MSDVLIRCDFSHGSGLGHLKRCSVLAAALMRRGLNPKIYIDQDAPDPEYLIVSACPILRIPAYMSPAQDAQYIKNIAEQEKARCAVCDSYSLLTDYENAFLNSAIPLVSLDDLGQSVSSKLVVNYTPGAARPGRLSASSKFLGGEQYFLTDLKRKTGKPDRSQTSRILIHSGASGAFDRRHDVFEALQRSAVQRDLETHWLCPTPDSRHWVQNNIALRPSDRMLDWSLNGGSLFAQYDIVAGPSSTSLYEAIMQGAVPISFTISDTQTDAKSAWAKLGHLLHLDHNDFSDAEAIDQVLGIAVDFMADLGASLETSARELDGNGAERVTGEIRRILGIESAVRSEQGGQDIPPAVIRPCTVHEVHDWWLARNAPWVRSVSTKPDHVIAWPEHIRWWFSTSAERFAVVRPDGTFSAFFWHNEKQIDGIDYLYGGWFPADDKPVFADVIRLLEWQLDHCNGHYPGRRWIATIDRENRAVLALNRRMGFSEAQPTSRAAAQILFPGTADRFDILERNS